MKETRLMTLLFGAIGSAMPLAKTRPRFTGTVYATELDSGKRLHHKTGFFRDPDVLSYVFDRYIQTRFPEGAPVVIGACSLGHEPYSAAMMMAAKNLSPDTYPTIASDINAGVVRLARSGVLELTPGDVEKGQKAIAHLQPYFSTSLDNAGADDKTVQAYGDRLVRTNLVKRTTKGGVRDYRQVERDWVKPGTLFQVSDAIKNRLHFETRDTVKHRFTKPSLVLFRHALQHFDVASRRAFLKRLYHKLPTGSALVIGKGDICKDVGRFVLEAGFQPAGGLYLAEDYQTKGGSYPWKAPLEKETTEEMFGFIRPFKTQQAMKRLKRLDDPRYVIFEKNG